MDRLLNLVRQCAEHCSSPKAGVAYRRHPYLLSFEPSLLVLFIPLVWRNTFRLVRLIQLWLDAKEAEFRRRAGIEKKNSN
jgi:hypothetical protein